MSTMRTVITRNKHGELIVQRERLSKRPDGNAQQRAKQMKHGWKPGWIADGRPVVCDSVTLADNVLPHIEISQEIVI